MTQSRLVGLFGAGKDLELGERHLKDNWWVEKSLGWRYARPWSYCSTWTSACTCTRRAAQARATEPVDGRHHVASIWQAKQNLYSRPSASPQAMPCTQTHTVGSLCSRPDARSVRLPIGLRPVRAWPALLTILVTWSEVALWLDVICSSLSSHHA